MPDVEVATKAELPTAPVLTGRSFRLQLSPRARALLVAGSVLSGCALWYIAFGKLGASYEALPWYIVLAGVGVVCALKAARPALADDSLGLLPQAALRQPVSLLESWAITYCLVSIALYLWVAMQLLSGPQQSRRLVQLVEINLVSDRDFANRNSPLPGTEEQEELHKRRAESVTRQGATTSHRVAQIARQSQPAPQKRAGDSKAETAPARASRPQHEQIPARNQAVVLRARQGSLPVSQPATSHAQDMILIKPAMASSNSAASTTRSATGKQTGEQPYLEEVQPPELVEMIDNEGSKQSANVFEAGGHSEGGTGAANDLSVYLKELHKRIKTMWSPPRGQSHRAAVLFRIRREGKLSFIKIIHSSGDSDTDDAAVKAIAGAVKGMRLPSDTKLPYLDVQYTFNYTADELKEIAKPAAADDDLL